MRMTIGKKLGFGFASIVALIGVATVFQLKSAGEVEAKTTQVLELRVPTVRAALEALRAMDRTTSNLRGFLITSDPDFRKRRLECWEETDKAVAELNELGKNFTNPENKARLAKTNEMVPGLKKIQDDIEQLMASNDNVPAQSTLLNEMEPRAAKMIAAMTEMKNEEEKAEATKERKTLLGLLGDCRGAISTGMGAVHSYVQTGDKKFKEAAEGRFETNRKAMEKIESMAGLLTETQKAKWAEYNAVRKEFNDLPAKVFTLREAPDWNKARHLEGTVLTQGAREVRKVLQELTDSQKDLLAKDDEATDAAVAMLKNVTYIAAGASFMIATFIGVFMTRQMVRSIRPVVERAKSIAAGDLTGTELKKLTNDECGDLTAAVNEMSKSLRGVVGELASSSNEVAAAATEIAASSEQMSGGIRQQNSQLAEMSSAVTEMNASISEVASQSAGASDVAKSSGETAEKGAKIVQGTIEEMNRISEQTSQSAKSVQGLGEQGKKIGQVVSVINDIAEQINLLALNAAIEAARAGEHGRGFAVVADEVRKLADRTQVATKEISGSITAIQSETDTVVQTIKLGTQRAESGVKQATSAGESLGEILAGAKRVAGVVQTIAAASQQQAAASEQISRSIEGVNTTAKATEQGANQCAAAATQLSSRAEALRSLVGRFRIDGAHGRGAEKAGSKQG